MCLVPGTVSGEPGGPELFYHRPGDPILLPGSASRLYSNGVTPGELHPVRTTPNCARYMFIGVV